MDRLWTPWRFNYITHAGQEGSCAFCDILAQASDAENLVLFRGGRVFVILNLFPYTSGHMLIVANRHIPFLSDASTEELHDFIELSRRCENALHREYRPDGYNMGFNLGRAAGAGVAHHLHMHVLPRWVGDSNFVSVVAETRILPEELPDTYRRLLPYFKEP